MKQADTKKFCGEIKEIETDADVENLIGITDRFHNAYVIKSEKNRRCRLCSFRRH